MNEFGKYKLVMAHNRDETMEKPSEPADFWENNSNIISGSDIFPRNGRNYSTDSTSKKGTCFGIDLRGRVGAFLDIENNYNRHNKGNDEYALEPGSAALRNFFDFTSKSSSNQDMPLESYQDALKNARDNYKNYQPYQMITGQCGSFYHSQLQKQNSKRVLSRNDDSGFLVQHYDDKRPIDDETNKGWHFDYTNTLLNIKEELKSGTIHAFCSSRQNPHSDNPSKEWRKISEGKFEFMNIIQEYGMDLTQYSQLAKRILELMKNQYFFLPDKNLENELTSLDYDSEDIKSKSSLFIAPNYIGDKKSVPQYPNLEEYYGTRNINLLLIDANNNVDFLESLLYYPTCLKNQVWNSTKFSFNLKVGSHIH
ncbi:unnamed protein product [Gordionus sp. m RMFG-2023]